MQNEALPCKVVEIKNNFKMATGPKQSKKKLTTGTSFLDGHMNALMKNIKEKPSSQKQQKQDKNMPQFNLDTRPAKYFDAEIDPKSKREQEKDAQRQSNKGNAKSVKGAPMVERNFEDGKFEVGFIGPNGQKGSKFEIYQFY